MKTAKTRLATPKRPKVPTFTLTPVPFKSEAQRREKDRDLVDCVIAAARKMALMKAGERHE